MKYEKLFSPLTIRGVTFRNRIQRTSMVSGLSTEDGWVTDELKKKIPARSKRGSRIDCGGSSRHHPLKEPIQSQD